MCVSRRNYLNVLLFHFTWSRNFPHLFSFHPATRVMVTETGVPFHSSVPLTIYGHASHKNPVNFPQFTGFKQKSRKLWEIYEMHAQRRVIIHEGGAYLHFTLVLTLIPSQTLRSRSKWPLRNCTEVFTLTDTH